MFAPCVKLRITRKRSSGTRMVLRLPVKVWLLKSFAAAKFADKETRSRARPHAETVFIFCFYFSDRGPGSNRLVDCIERYSADVGCLLTLPDRVLPNRAVYHNFSTAACGPA